VGIAEGGGVINLAHKSFEETQCLVKADHFGVRVNRGGDD